MYLQCEIICEQICVLKQNVVKQNSYIEWVMCDEKIDYNC